MYYNTCGVVYKNLGNLNSAIKDYDIAIKLEPNFVSAYDNRAKAYYILKEYAKVINDYLHEIELDSNNSFYYYKKIGDCYYKLGDYNTAIENSNKA
ncbi:MAG TPA: tetratricopeptide repeat protein [Ignavibacteriales bacterium]|nr:tetratricopeptide repeat protein [Ignavibacteriales bacterium]